MGGISTRHALAPLTVVVSGAKDYQLESGLFGSRGLALRRGLLDDIISRGRALARLDVVTVAGSASAATATTVAVTATTFAALFVGFGTL